MRTKLLRRLESFGTIYIITNEINQKQYIGQTRDAEIRQTQHLFLKHTQYEQTQLGKAVFEFGPGAFAFRQIYVAFDKEELDRSETYFITVFNTVEPFGYNACVGTFVDHHLSEPAKLRHRQATIAAMNTPEMIAKQRAGAIAQYADPEKKARHKEAHNTPEYLEKITKIQLSLSAQKSAKVSSMRWATDGTNNRRLLPNESLQSGWQFGRAKTESINPVKARHTRYHVNRGTIDRNCEFCRQLLKEL